MQKTINKLIDFRFTQALRLFQSIGAIYLILVAFLLSGVLLNFIANVLVKPQPWLGFLFLFLTTSIHLNRNDGGFLDHLEISKPVLYNFEYHLLCIPFYILLMSSNNWIALSILIIGNTMLSLIPSSQWKLKAQNWELHFIPIQAF